MDELIDFDYIPDEGEDLQVTTLKPPVVVQVETSMPTAVATAIEVNEPWKILRDYVVDQIVRYNGPFPRNPKQESGIFKSFVSRWGDQAMAIAKVAFEVHQGVWHNAPIRIGRFTINSDPYFACVIARELDPAPSA